MMNMKKEWTREELAEFDGKKIDRALVAVNGKVYDVSANWAWRRGNHMMVHKAGTDLTKELCRSDHGEAVLAKMKCVGTLKD